MLITWDRYLGATRSKKVYPQGARDLGGKVSLVDSPWQLLSPALYQPWAVGEQGYFCPGAHRLTGGQTSELKHTAVRPSPAACYKTARACAASIHILPSSQWLCPSLSHSAQSDITYVLAVLVFCCCITNCYTFSDNTYFLS